MMMVSYEPKKRSGQLSKFEPTNKTRSSLEGELGSFGETENNFREETISPKHLSKCSIHESVER